MLVIQQFQHNRTNRGLIDRILENRGMAALPDEHPLVDAVTKIAGSAKEPFTEEQKRAMAKAKGRITFRIPNMPKMGSNY
jgi:DNA polymerase III sliding clamp (beta) subunit (PCNA family)